MNINVISDSITVSEHILWSRHNEGIPTTPMQVLKLTYLCHGWVLGWDEGVLIREMVEAWQYGPVIPNMYHHYKRFGGGRITDTGEDHSEVFPENVLETISSVLDVYKKYSGLSLSSITHKPGSPWDIAYNNYGPGSIIPTELIHRYYSELVNNL